MSTMIPCAVLLVGGIVAGVLDIWKFKVHNALTFPLLVSGLLYHWAVDGGAGAFASVVGAVLGGSILLLPYFLGGIGGGDVKLMAAVGAWSGAFGITQLFIVTGLLVGLYSLVLVARNARVRSSIWVNMQIAMYQFKALSSYVLVEERVEKVVRLGDRRERLVPFAAMMAVAIVITLVIQWLR